MNQRIIDALNTAGMKSVDVTNTMESIFGTIPAICKGTAPNIKAPGNVRITNVIP